MQAPIIVYEDSGWQRLLPLVYMRAVFQLVCGMGDLLSKAERLAQSADRTQQGNGRGALPQTNQFAAWCRAGLAEIVAEQTGLSVNAAVDQPALLLNGRGLWRRLPTIRHDDSSWIGTVGERSEIACIYAGADLAQTLSPSVFLDQAKSWAALSGLPRRDVSEHVTLLTWPWEIVLANERSLTADWEHAGLGAGRIQATVPRGAHLLCRDSIRIGNGTRIKPTAVIDAEDGPVWIGENVTVLPHCYVQGPAFIGDGCLLQPGAVVHSGTTIGPRCKVGGEIEASIIHGYSNKQHDGFLGHSYVGSWVNIAADCINSDLKNTYGTVRVPINGHDVETGEMFVGMFVGDYSKAGINVSFPTGAVVGFCSSVFAPRSPKFVPSYAWIDADAAQRYDESRGLAIARKVMARRECTMTAAEERAFLAVRQQALAIEHQPQAALEARLAAR